MDSIPNVWRLVIGCFVPIGGLSHLGVDAAISFRSRTGVPAHVGSALGDPRGSHDRSGGGALASYSGSDLVTGLLDGAER